MAESQDMIAGLIITWLPLLLFLGAVAWHARQVRNCMTMKDGRSLADLFDEVANELKRANDARNSLRQS